MSNPEPLDAEFKTKCPKCRAEAWVVFNNKTGEKSIGCRHCNYFGPAADLAFNPNPAFLYKYRSHDDYSPSWILREDLYFASPGSFNDPFDSKVMYTIEGTIEQKKRYYSEAFQMTHPQMKKREKWKYINKGLKDNVLENDYPNHIKRMQDKIDGYGVVSFSEKPDNLLMFSYYAENHTGYCLKYRRSKENILSLARKIDYTPTYPRFSVFDFPPTKVGGLGDKVLFTKAECWKHEAEWRVGFANPLNRLIKSPHPLLEGIILGCNMKPEKREEILVLNNRRDKPVQIFEARKKQFEFALEIVELFPVKPMKT